MINLFKKRKQLEHLDFSEENIEKFIIISDLIGDTLIKSGYGYLVDYLSQIRLRAEERDSNGFKKLVISNELFGGAGSLCDIWIEEKELRQKFEKEFADYLDLLMVIGLDDIRIRRERKIIKKKSQCTTAAKPNQGLICG